MTRFPRSVPALAGLTAISLTGACQLAVDENEEVELGTRAQPLIGGTVTEGDLAVAALTRGGTASFCTGTLVSPSVVLTAAHCIDMAGTDPSVIAFFGKDTKGEGIKIGFKTKKQHVMWDGDLKSTQYSYDIGMLLLNFPHPDPLLPMPMNETVLTDFEGADYRHVGFGVYDRETGSSDGQKREGTTTITGFRHDVALSGDENLSVCFGDSGGPALITIDDVEYVAGVHSFTQSDDCFPPNGDTRVDLFLADFVRPWIQENDPVCGMDGTCAPVGCVDDPDCTPCGPDGTCVSDCELPDPDCATSAVGEICQADTQCMEGRCVFWNGDVDYNFCASECEAGNDASCPDGMSCQNVSPFGDICYYDDDPPGVLGDKCEAPTDCGSYLCEGGRCVTPCNLAMGQGCPADFECTTEDDVGYYCFPTGESGGCQVSGGGAGASAALLLLAALGAHLRRRRVTVRRAL